MSSSLQRLLPLFERDWARHLPLVLATLVRTDGSTYTKPGAHMLIAGNGEYAGLLSGGCLEGDLAEHGRAVLATGVAKLARYNTQGAEDLLFGLGSGCEGTMDILLRRLDGSNVTGNHEALLWRC
jgi:xanthine/CO dehydrogenase XdhC/CoxF family maturation factor